MIAMTTTTYYFTAPVTGKCVPIEATYDMELSNKMLGNGVSIFATEGTVTAPFDCMVTVVSQTQHAVVILDTKHDIEMMLCADTDTADEVTCSFCVQPGSTVKQGEPLFSCDVQGVQAKGGHVTFSCILTNLPAEDVHVMSGDVIGGKSHMMSCACVG